MSKRVKGVNRMANKLSLSDLDAMSTDDLKVLRQAVGMILKLKGAVATRKPKK